MGQKIGSFRWATPEEWLIWSLKEWDRNKLVNTIRCLIDKMDSDDIQDIFQQEMDEDGYFVSEELPKY